MSATKSSTNKVLWNSPVWNSSKLTSTPSKLGSHGTDQMISKFIPQDLDSASGKHGEVFFVYTPRRTTTLAVKRQPIREPHKISDKAYRELRILQQLSKLNSKNFISIVDWFKVHDLNASQSILNRTPGGKNYYQYFMHYVLEFAGTTLAQHIKQLDVDQVRSITFQIVHALNLAAEEFQFNHNDLHAKNILLKQMDEGELEFYDVMDKLGLKRRFQTRFYLVKLCDFGLSRIALKNGEIVYNDSNSITEMFNPTNDLETLESSLKHVRTIGWNEDDIDSWRSLRRTMLSCGNDIRKLVLHPFFDDLRVDTEGLKQQQVKLENRMKQHSKSLQQNAIAIATHGGSTNKQEPLLESLIEDLRMDSETPRTTTMDDTSNEHSIEHSSSLPPRHPTRHKQSLDLPLSQLESVGNFGINDRKDTSSVAPRSPPSTPVSKKVPHSAFVRRSKPLQAQLELEFAQDPNNINSNGKISSPLIRRLFDSDDTILLNNAEARPRNIMKPNNETQTPTSNATYYTSPRTRSQSAKQKEERENSNNFQTPKTNTTAAKHKGISRVLSMDTPSPLKRTPKK